MSTNSQNAVVELEPINTSSVKVEIVAEEASPTNNGDAGSEEQKTAPTNNSDAKIEEQKASHNGIDEALKGLYDIILNKST